MENFGGGWWGILVEAFCERFYVGDFLDYFGVIIFVEYFVVFIWRILVGVRVAVCDSD